MLKREAVHERLGHRLNGEGDVSVAHGIELPVHRGDGDAEQVGVDLAEFGDVVGRRATLELRHPRMQLGEVILDWRKSGVPSLSQAPDRIHPVQRFPQTCVCGHGTRRVLVRIRAKWKAKHYQDSTPSARPCLPNVCALGVQTTDYFLRKLSSCTTSAGGRDITTSALAGSAGSSAVGSVPRVSSGCSPTRSGRAEAMCWRAESLAAPGLPN